METKINIFNLLYARVYLAAFFAINSASWFFAYWFFKRVSQNLIVLHYNVDFGIDLIGDVKNIFVIPAIGLFIIVLNLFLSFVFLKDKNFKFISHLLLASAVLANLILFLSMGPIYFINFR